MWRLQTAPSTQHLNSKAKAITIIGFDCPNTVEVEDDLLDVMGRTEEDVVIQLFDLGGQHQRV